MERRDEAAQPGSEEAAKTTNQEVCLRQKAQQGQGTETPRTRETLTPSPGSPSSLILLHSEPLCSGRQGSLY